MEHIFDIDAVDIEAEISALSESFQRQLRYSTTPNFARYYILGNIMGRPADDLVFSIRDIGQDSICVEDTLTWEKLDHLRNLIWRQKGVDYVVSAIQGRGEMVHDYGGEYVESYTEIHFTRKDA